jgi:LysM repeat protein
MWLWLLIGVGLIGGYYLIAHRGGSSSSTGAAGGTTSAAQVPQFVNQTYTTIQPPVVPQATPAPTAAPGPQVGEKTLTVGRAMTLKQFSKEHNWTDTTLAAVEKLNNLKPGAKLKKGQKIKRPWAPIQPGQTPLPAG